MRIAFVMAAQTLGSAQVAVQNSSPTPPAVYPMPPPMVMSTPTGHDVAARMDTTDRAMRCLQYGKSIGVPADQMADYTRRCALQ